MKHLTRSRRHRIIAGVCGGIAEYLGTNVALVRILVLLLACVGSGIVLYIAGLIVMPQESGDARSDAEAPASEAATLTTGIGLLLVVIGSLWFLDRVNPLGMHAFWHLLRNVFVPVAIILFGIAVLMRRSRAAQSSSHAGADRRPLEQAPLREGQWYRTRTDRKLLGVCGGIAHAMNVDPTVVRLAWVLLTLHSFGLGLIVYLILAIVLPEESLASTPS